MYTISFVNMPRIWVAPWLKQQQSNPHPSPVRSRVADWPVSSLRMSKYKRTPRVCCSPWIRCSPAAMSIAATGSERFD